MSFERKDWKDRIAEYINRRRITHEDGTSELITVERDEGTISQEGDAFNAENMNEFEERIAKALTPLDTMEEVNANTQDNQLAGANAVKELANEKYSYFAGKNFETEDELLAYAHSLLSTNTNIFIVIGLEIGNGAPAPNYAPGFIVIRKDVCSVVLFGYASSRICVNSRSLTNTEWTGWKEQAFSDDLAKYLPLTGIIDNLTSTTNNKALSANMGRYLKSLICGDDGYWYLGAKSVSTALLTFARKCKTGFTPIYTIGDTDASEGAPSTLYTSGFVTSRGNSGAILLFAGYEDAIFYARFDESITKLKFLKLATVTDLASYLPSTGGTLSGNLIVGDGADANRRVVAKSNARLVSMLADGSSGGSGAGLYDELKGEWILKTDSDLNVEIPHPTTVNGSKVLTAADFSVVNNVVTLNLS